MGGGTHPIPIGVPWRTPLSARWGTTPHQPDGVPPPPHQPDGGTLLIGQMRVTPLPHQQDGVPP